MRNYLKTTSLLTALFLVANWLVYSQTVAPSTIVKVEGGKVEGTIENGITIFRGIPFAAPPVGDQRWRASQPVKKWNLRHLMVRDLI